MPGEKISDLSAEERLDLLKKDFFSYIEKNTGKVDQNLPVFYGYVIASLENISKDLSDSAYDDFIDAITYKVFQVRRETLDSSFIERVTSSALRSKRHPNNRAGIDIAAGLQLLKGGDYLHAPDYLKQYIRLDAIVGASVAYCYYMLSLKELADQSRALAGRPSERELLAREQMILLAQNNPPVNLLPQFNSKDEPELARAFWLMISCALDWFPSEQRFFYIGLEKARKDGNKEMRFELLKIANERFYNDMYFLREAYSIRLEQLDAIGAAGVVKQMMQHYPDELEPVYYGIKLSLLTSTKSTFESFRKQAIAKGMPAHIVQLLDLALALMSKDRQMASVVLREIRKKAPALQYYLLALEYIAQDFFADDDRKVKRAKKALIDSLDLYCLQAMKIPVAAMPA